MEPDGDLTPINKVGIDGMRGCYLSVDQTGKYLFVGGYHDGKVTVVHTHRDGRLGSVMDGVFHKGLGSVAERNFRPHVNCVVPTPENKFICAVDNGIDQVKIYRITPHNKLSLVDILRCARESGPRLLLFSRDGRFAYLLYELSNTVDVFAYSCGKTPVFEKLQTVSTTSDNVDQKHDAASGMCFSPDGNYLFTSTAGDNTVAMFRIDRETGMLTKEFALPISGEYPKDIAMFPDGKHIAVVNHESNSITTFTVDYEKKITGHEGKTHESGNPQLYSDYQRRSITAVRKEIGKISGLRKKQAATGSGKMPGNHGSLYDLDSEKSPRPKLHRFSMMSASSSMLICLSSIS